MPHVSSCALVIYGIAIMILLIVIFFMGIGGALNNGVYPIP